MIADVLEIRLGGRRIGALTALGGDRSILSFDNDYIADPDRPVLSLSFQDEAGGLILDHDPVQTRVQPFFSNLLPEGGLRDYLARRAGVKPVREYALLQALGGDLPGAVTLTPAGAARADEDIDEPDEDRAVGEEAMRFSLAGVQLKFSAKVEGQARVTVPAGGAGGDWIVKLPSALWVDLAENEFSMMALARRVGLDVPETRLVPVETIEGLPNGVVRADAQAYMVRRFDRAADGARLHIEDFAQVFGVYPEEKYRRARYRSIAQVLWREIGEAAVSEFIGRLIFNTLIGNADMHLKNWSLLYRDGRTPSLAPGYDFVSTTSYMADETAALRYETTNRTAAFDVDELNRLAARAGVPQRLAQKTAGRTVAAFREVWAADAVHLPLTVGVRTEIDRLLGALPIARLA